MTSQRQILFDRLFIQTAVNTDFVLLPGESLLHALKQSRTRPAKKEILGSA